MKKFLTIIGLGLLLTSGVKGVDVAVTWTNGPALNFTNVVDGGCRVALLSLVNNINLANNFTIWDAPLSTNGAAALNLAVVGQNVISNSLGQLCFTNGSYGSIVQYLTNIQVYATNSMGLTNFQVLGGTYTNNPVYKSNVLWTATNTVTGTLVAYRLLFSGTIAGNATLTITNQFNCTRGLLYSTPTVASNTVNVTYAPSL